jgi:hypothetical protein
VCFAARGASPCANAHRPGRARSTPVPPPASPATMDWAYVLVSTLMVGVLVALTYKVVLRSWFFPQSVKKREEEGLFPRPPYWQQGFGEGDGVRRRGGAFGELRPLD